MLGNLSLNISHIETVYYHGSCPDGIIAREVLKLTGKSLKYIPYYFSEFKEVPKNALFIDCSPKHYQVESSLQNNCLIAEHHDSFDFHYWHPYHSQILFGENSNAESGAALALWILGVYDPTFHNEKIIELVNYIAISDTWRKDEIDFDYARMLAGYIVFFGNDFCENLESLVDRYETIRAFGKVQENKQKQFAETAMRYHTPNYKLAFINETNMSNAAEILRQEGNDVVVGFKMLYDTRLSKMMIRYSLRSNNRFDCAVFCVANGGGGHKAAAGFTLEYVNQDPIMAFLDLFTVYEGTL